MNKDAPRNREKVILAVDHGTSGVKVSLITLTGQILASASEKTEVLYLPGGGAEQNPEDWWQAFVRAARRLLDSGTVPKEEVAAVAVSSTFSTTVPVGSDDRPVMNAITWMDSRGGPYVRAIARGFPSFQGYGLRNIYQWISRTGGGPSLSGKDDIGHVLFIQAAFPEVYEKTRVFLPSKDYFNLRLCGETAATYDSIHLFWVTDIRDIRNIRYDDALIRRFGIDKAKLPPLLPSTAILGTLRPAVARELGLGTAVNVVAGSPDHQSACIGSGAVRDFEGHLYVGTSSWIQCLVPFKKTDMLHSIASFPTAIPERYQSVNEQDMAGGVLAHFAEQFMSGQVEQPAPRNIYREMDALAEQSKPGSGNLMFLPWLNGERTPVDDPYLRGGLLNLSVSSSRSDIIRALLEGVAYNTRWSLGYVERFVGRTLDPINMVGGGAQSDLWCRIFADVLGRSIRRVKNPVGANARGAAFIAAVGLGHIAFSEIPALTQYDRVFEPDASTRGLYEDRFEQFLRWHKASKPLFHAMNP